MKKIKYFTDSDISGLGYVTPVVKEDIVTYKEVDKIVKTGEGEQDFIVEKVVVEESRVDLDEYITSFSDEVGIENILAKAKLTGDESLLHRVNGIYADLSEVPQSISEAQAVVEAGKAAAEKAGIDFNKEAIDAYIKAEVEKALAAKSAEAPKEGV